MPARIVTSTYRYRRPPKKRKAVPLEGPAVATPKSKAATFDAGQQKLTGPMQAASVACCAGGFYCGGAATWRA
jgi:hypothetical protein